MQRELMPCKVLMVLESCYPTEGGGGAENQVRTICRYLNERNIPVEIIAPMTREAPQVEHDEVDGVPVWRIPYPQVRVFGGLLMLWRLAAYLVRRRDDYRVIHAHIAHNMATVSSAVGWVLGKTVIVKLTGWLELQKGVLAPGRSPLMALKRFALRRADYIQATSTEIRRRLIARGFSDDQVRVIPNAVDIERFAPAFENRHEQMTDKPLTFVYVGRLVPEKGVDTLFDAWEKAFTPDTPVRLHLVGDGYLRDAFAERIEASWREHQVELFGARSDVENCLRDADAGVLPSLYEGLSNTLLEYMAAGLPVLGTRVSGTEDFIEHGRSGWLVESGNVEQMTVALREMQALGREGLASIGAAARQRVLAHASIDAVIEQLGQLYEISGALAATRRHEWAPRG